MTTKLRNVLLWLLSAFILCSIWFGYDLYHFASTPLLPNNQSVDYILKSGLGIQALSDDLIALGILKRRQKYYLRFLIKLRGDAMKLKSGEYRLQPGETPDQIIDQIVAGRVLYHSFTIIDGWTFANLKAALDESPFIKHTLVHDSTSQVMQQLGLTQQSPEGLFFPDTYKFTLNTKDTTLLKWACQVMQQHLQKAWQGRAKHLPYKNAYQALIAASLIEKETAIPKEGPMIAGVLVRRLQKRMRLQFDPTVIFAMGASYNGNISKKDLRMKSPYNTYTVYGLPPTPIAFPSLHSIESALHPDDSDNLYFVATGDGGHVFSADLKSHNIAVQEYIKKRIKARDRRRNLPKQTQGAYITPWQWLSATKTSSPCTNGYLALPVHGSSLICHDNGIS
jgi:UPF0755 protein